MTMATKVITGKCRASFVHIFEPQSINGSDPKYSMSLIIPKSDSKTIGAIKAAIDEAIQNGISGKWGGKRPPNLKLPLRDGDVDREEDEAYQDAYLVNATSLELLPRTRSIVDKLVLLTTATDGTVTYYPLYAAQDGEVWTYRGLNLSDGAVVEEPSQANGEIIPIDMGK